MKPIAEIFFLVVTLTIIGCCKDDDVIPYFDFKIYWKGLQEYGSATAKVFDKNWEASAYVFPDVNQPQFFSVIFETYSNDGFMRDVIQFGNLSAKVGEYNVVKDSTADPFDDNIIYGFYVQYEDDGDVVYGGYELDTDNSNVVYIDKVDTVGHEIEGRFSLLFKLNEDYYHQDLAKKVLFEDGTFKVKM